MNRREFVNALGIGTVQVCLANTLFASPLLADSFSSLKNGHAHPVLFKRYHGHRGDKLMRRKKFREFIEAQFPNVVVPFYFNQPIWNALWSWTNNPGHIHVHHNRFITMNGERFQFAPCRAMLWIDGRGSENNPLTVITFMNVNGPNRDLWIMANHNIADLSHSDIPHHLPLSIGRWLRQHKNPKRTDLGYITRVYLYDNSPESSSRLVSPGDWGVSMKRCERNVVMYSKPLLTANAS